MVDEGIKKIDKSKKMQTSIYSEGPYQSFDFISPYLKFLLGFLGVTDVSFVRAEGISVEGEDTALQKGVESIVID